MYGMILKEKHSSYCWWPSEGPHCENLCDKQFICPLVFNYGVGLESVHLPKTITNILWACVCLVTSRRSSVMLFFNCSVVKSTRTSHLRHRVEMWLWVTFRSKSHPYEKHWSKSLQVSDIEDAVCKNRPPVTVMLKTNRGQHLSRVTSKCCHL